MNKLITKRHKKEPIQN